MSSPQGSLFGFPNMLLGLGAFAAVTALGVAVLTGARLHRPLRIVGRILRDPVALRRVRHMRRVFRRHSAHLGAVSLLAVPTPSQL
jgi:hypothetical protein